MSSNLNLETYRRSGCSVCQEIHPVRQTVIGFCANRNSANTDRQTFVICLLMLWSARTPEVTH